LRAEFLEQRSLRRLADSAVIAAETSSVFASASCMHCMTVSLALDGEGLGAAWGEQKALQMLGDAGFTQVEVKRVEADLFNNYYIATKQAADQRTGH